MIAAKWELAETLLWAPSAAPHHRIRKVDDIATLDFTSWEASVVTEEITFSGYDCKTGAYVDCEMGADRNSEVDTACYSNPPGNLNLTEVEVEFSASLEVTS